MQHTGTRLSKSKTLPRLLLVAALATTLLAGCVTSQEELLAQAKISREAAQKIALTKAPDGTVKEAELEKEHGRLVLRHRAARHQGHHRSPRGRQDG